MNISSENKNKNNTLILWLAFAAVYVLWGSTYLALRFALETMPPFLMASFRFIIAGSIMLIFSKLKKEVWPSKDEIRNSGFVGILLLVVGNGGVVWAEQYIDSGITALIVTIEPVWVVLLMWMRGREHKPSFIVWLGIFLGLSGILMLVGPSTFGSVNQLNPYGVAALMLSSISWAIGSVFAMRIKLPTSSTMSTGFQMMIAGIGMFFIGSIHGEWINFDINSISQNSILGLLYLIIFGSLIGFTSYGYLVKHTSPSNVSTYAFVNPIVAVFLGWWIGNEQVGIYTLVAGLLLIAAVVLIILKPKIKYSFGSIKITFL